MKVKKAKIVPVLLGSDMNVYGMARSFHEQYGIMSYSLGKGCLPATKYSKIINSKIIEKFEDENVFVKTLLDFSKQFNDEKLLLIACGDTYVEPLINNKDVLSTRYIIPYIDKQLMQEIVAKEKFYDICEKYDLPYPKTEIVSKKNYQKLQLTLNFPVVIKPSNSVLYWKVSFKGKKKAFVAQTLEEFKIILERIYNSKYDDELILQEYIPGDDSCMRVINNYSTRDGRVVMQGLGHVLLEEHSPVGIGSHAAIISIRDEELENKVKFFLEDINYQGYSNFDMKYDHRDGKYKFFEINLRQGRSSYYVTAAGCNLAKYIVEDYVYKRELTMEKVEENILWRVVPTRVITHYVPVVELKELVKKLIKQKRVVNSLFYQEDLNMKRRLEQTVEYYKYFAKYYKHFGKKGM